MSELTDRQAEILQFIRHAVHENGCPPSRDEIAEAFGFNSVTAAKNHLLALERKGVIQLVEGSRRNIRLLVDSDTALTHQFQLPLVGQIAAGTPITAPENVETWFNIDPDLFHPRADFLHRVAGHSMKEADICDGDIVAIHEQADADNGQIVAAVVPHPKTGEEQITLKRYLRRGSKITLRPENSSSVYKAIEIDLSGFDPESQDQAPFRIAGIFAGLIRIPR
ncbi:MAG: lexA [Nevskia sp.]|nr:lexA [Nevskia sp.]